MPNRISLARITLYSLVFLLFFQLVADFVETIYAFGLLGTNIPPEIISVLLFFTPLILLFFRKGLSRQIGWIFVMCAGVMRAVEVVTSTSGKMLASGLGTGILLVLFPVWLAQRREDDESMGMEMGSGLAGSLALSILLRTLGAGSDISLLNPWLSWIELAALIILAVNLSRRPHPVSTTAISAGTSKTSFGRCTILSIGVVGSLTVLYFGFTSPTVLARWSGVDYRLVVGLLVGTLGAYLFINAKGWLGRMSRPVIGAWNVLFLASGSAAIWMNQVRFPAGSSSYPLDQPVLSLAQQLPLMIMILLCPIIMFDFALLVDEIKVRLPSPRSLAGGFSLGALFLLLIVLAQAFTTVYDYIPVVGPPLRDRFWLVFLITGLGMVLPVIATHPQTTLKVPTIVVNRFVPSVCVVLLAAFSWVLATQPSPVASIDQSILRVVTYNLQQGYSAAGDRNYAGQLELIRNLEPDIVGLEESDVARFSGGNADVVRTISEGLGMAAYYGPRTVTGTFGIALLSRFPLENPRTFFMYSSAEQTAAIEAQIIVNGKKFTILVTHLGNGGPLIQQQQVLSRLASQPNVIAMGDFNFEPTTEQYALTVQTLQDAWVQDGMPLPPGLDGRQLIDHVFISPGMAVGEVRYVNSPASDHPALMVVIRP